ncbi:MAG: ribonuclease P protein component [Actinomycetota bacterium]
MKLAASTGCRVGRLRRSSDIREVLAQRQRWRGEHVDVHLHDRGEGDPRVAVVAGKRVGTAVERNRAKRRLRAAAAATPAPRGRDAVVIARPSAVHAPFDEVRDEVARLAGPLPERGARRRG